jgi:hypothetical protein
MPVNVRSADHLNLPTEEAAATISQSSELPSASAQELQTRTNQAIKNAAQNFDQIVGVSTFTTETNGTTTTINFGDDINGAKLPTAPTGETGYRTGSGEAGNNPAAGETHESQIESLLKSELGVDSQKAQQLANAIAQGGQAGTEIALAIAEATSQLQNNGTDETNQTDTQGSTGDPVATRDNDFSALIDHEKMRHIKA